MVLGKREVVSIALLAASVAGAALGVLDPAFVPTVILMVASAYGILTIGEARTKLDAQARREQAALPPQVERDSTRGD